MHKMTLYNRRKLHLTVLIAWEMRRKRCRHVCKSQNVCTLIIKKIRNSCTSSKEKLLCVTWRLGMNILCMALKSCMHVSYIFSQYFLLCFLARVGSIFFHRFCCKYELQWSICLFRSVLPFGHMLSIFSEEKVMVLNQRDKIVFCL